MPLMPIDRSAAAMQRVLATARVLADSTGEVVFVINQPAPTLTAGGLCDRLPYAVLLSQATPWEKDPRNHAARVTPAGFSDR